MRATRLLLAVRNRRVEDEVGGKRNWPLCKRCNHHHQHRHIHCRRIEEINGLLHYDGRRREDSCYVESHCTCFMGRGEALHERETFTRFSILLRGVWSVPRAAHSRLHAAGADWGQRASRDGTAEWNWMDQMSQRIVRVRAGVYAYRAVR